MSWLRRSLALGGLLVLGLMVLLGGLLGTQSGSLWLLQQIPGLEVSDFEGQLGRQWQARQLRWQQDGQRLELQQLQLRWQPLCLFRLTLCLEQVQAQSAHWRSGPSDDSPTTEAPIQLPVLPFQLALGSVRLEELRIDDQPPLHQLHLQEAQLHTTEGWPLQAQLQLQIPVPQQPALTLKAELEGPLQGAMQLHLETQGYLNSQSRLQISLLDPQLPLRFNLDSPEFKPSPELPDHLRLHALTLHLEGNLKQGYQLKGESQLGLQREIPLQLQALIGPEQLELHQLRLSAEAQQSVTLKGSLRWSDLHSQWELDWQHFPWQRLYPAPNPPVELQQLKARLNYRASGYEGQLNAELQGPAGRFSLETPLRGTATQIELPALRLIAGQGKASGLLQLDWAQSLRWRAQLEVSALNPAYWVAELPGVLAGTLRSEGEYKADRLQASAALDLKGRLRNAPAQLRLNAQAQNQDWQLQNLDLQLGNNRLQGELAWAQKLSGALAINLRGLSQLWPGLAGQANGQLQLSGTPSQPQGSLSLKGQGLSYEGQRLRQLELNSRLSTNRQLSLQLKVSGLSSGQTDLGQLNLNAEGSLERHQAQLDWQAPNLKLNLSLQGQQQGERWLETLTQGQIQIARQVWTLSQSPRIEYQPQRGQLLLSAHCWQSGEASLCADNQRLLPEPQLSYRLRQFPLDSLNPWLPEDLRWQGQLNADLLLQRPKAGPKGSLRLEANNGLLQRREGKDWQKYPYQNLSLEAQLQPRQVDTQLLFRGKDLGELQLQARINPQTAAKPIQGQFSLQGLDLKLARPFLSQAVERLEGQINGSGQLTGSLQKPRLEGQLRLENGLISGGQLPSALENLRLQADIAGEQLNLKGDWRSGAEGRGQINGSLSWAQVLNLQLRLQGQSLPVQLEPYAKLSVFPDVSIQLQGERLSVTGLVQVPKGEIRVRQLPPSTVKVSADTVIVGQETPTQTAASTPDLHMDVRIEVGKEGLNFNGFGFSADIKGQVHVGDNLNTRGELQLNNGRYQAYGQRLSIRRARLLFTGPINQPFVDMEAIRSLEDENLIAGLRLSGSATQPKAEVFTEPPTNPEQALSYLIMGHATGAKTGDSNLLARAALGLGLSGSSSLTASLAQQLGVKDFQLDTSGSGESTSLIASGRLTDKLSLRYGVGVFEPGNTLALRYQLSQRLFLEAASGLSSSLDLFYRREF